MLPWSRRGIIADCRLCIPLPVAGLAGVVIPVAPVSLVVLAILALGTAGCAGGQLRVSVRELRARTNQARDNGALRCAPRELALAEANTEFADSELDEGDYLRAREHVAVAEASVEQAIRQSAPDKCLDPSRPSDRDGDGIVDGDDKCPTDAEDKDGFEDADGCPDPDNDHDGVADRDDKCPTDAEDKDGFEDADGCPDPDNDHDEVADGDDKCPTEAGLADNPDGAGCPKKYEHIVVTEQKIELRQKIFFETNKAVIMSRSYGLLSEIASVLQTRPTMHVRIEGHTDARGTPQHNVILSQARADAVRMHLAGLGVDGARMEARGFGSEQPIETNKTAAGRERNRRVEFVITTQ